MGWVALLNITDYKYMRTIRTAEVNSHSLIRVELSVHGKRESEQTPWFSVFPDDLTGVKVEGEHHIWLQKVRIKEKCDESSRGSTVQQHRSDVQMRPVQSKVKSP